MAIGKANHETITYIGRHRRLLVHSCKALANTEELATYSLPIPMCHILLYPTPLCLL